ncbi:hypothetical protein ACHAWU_001906 [Discostella pseudostelligera]|uniref:Uncharacterized protein n=1 Tax=Discostella pseudostelligera TaxID=259834 RepID=A0ABD3N1W4_9STRA
MNAWGPTLFRRYYYRMTYESFWILHDKLGDSIELLKGRQPSVRGGEDSSGRGGNYVDPPSPNGKISNDTRLACALRYFAGGSPGDILSTYRISLTEVLFSVWGVVEAVNQFEEFHISYPASHELQQRIAADFAAVSDDVNFTVCAGAIDGVLICIGEPSEKDAEKAQISRKKLFCARKKKFGLNCIQYRIVVGRILRGYSINYGGASSDCLAFEASKLKLIVQNESDARQLLTTFLLQMQASQTKPSTNSSAFVSNVHLASWSIVGQYFARDLISMSQLLKR